MTEHQVLFAKLLGEDAENVKAIPVRRQELIATLAHIVLEERALQQDVIENGSFYETHGDKGQLIIKKRPQYEELGRLRDRKLRYSKELGINIEAVTWDDF